MKIYSENKSKFNLIIDIIMLLLLIPLAGIGFLMKYVLISGSERNVIYGNNVDLELFGLSRHQWGSIHLTLSIIFLILLFLHIIFNWKLIVSVFQQMVKSKANRFGVTIFLALFCLTALISPFIITPKQVVFEPKYKNKGRFERSSFNRYPDNNNSKDSPDRKTNKTGNSIGHRDSQKINTINANSIRHNSEYGEYEVYGYQTLQFVAQKYNVPVNKIAIDLNIPENLAGERLSYLKKTYSFTMADVRKSLANNKEK